MVQREPASFGFGTRRALFLSLAVLVSTVRSGAYVTVCATELFDAKPSQKLQKSL